MNEPVWRKAAASSVVHCVEVARPGGEVLIRDSKAPDGPWLSVSPAAWRRFLRANA